MIQTIRPRTARTSRPQSIFVLADDSGSMNSGHPKTKAGAATDGIKSLAYRLQQLGGGEKSYFELTLIRFGDTSEVMLDGVKACNVNADSIDLRGTFGSTNLTAALDACLQRLQGVAERINRHEDRSRHPVPLVIVFSDGHCNAGGSPIAPADRIKSLRFDGLPPVVVAAGVAVDGSDSPDEATLRAVASPECYLTIRQLHVLEDLIATVGSSMVQQSEQAADIIRDLNAAEAVHV